MEYLKHLKKDKVLKGILQNASPMVITQKANVWEALCRSIISQQLSTRVAEVIYQRFVDLYLKSKPTPQAIIDTPDETLRGVGLSYSKIGYIKNVARFEMEHGMNAKKLSKLSDEEIINYLTQIKGVGRWTAEMLLMFTIGREDVFPVDDLGVSTAMINLYGITTADKKQLKTQLIEIAANWAPYRTYACMHLWRWKDS